jgi:hypothetical protein
MGRELDFRAPSKASSGGRPRAPCEAQHHSCITTRRLLTVQVSCQYEIHLDISATRAVNVSRMLTATSAAYTGVNVGLAIWLFMSDRHSSPRPRTRFCSRGRAADCAGYSSCLVVSSALMMLLQWQPGHGVNNAQSMAVTEQGMRYRTSPKNSGRICLMFMMLTLLTRPLSDLRSASHVMR